MRVVIVLILMVLLTGCVNQGDFVVEKREDVRNLTYENTKQLKVDEAENDLNSETLKRVQGDMDDVKEVVIEEVKLPRKINWDVDFQSQAPSGNWDLPYQEACEEAVLILADRYFNEEDISVSEMEDEIGKLVGWQEDRFGFYTDTTLLEVQEMAEEYFNLNTEITDNVTTEKIKEELAKGNLIIAPTAGRMLGNPNFSGAGPIYHFVVIRGYDRNEFIVNDVGTRKGDGYKYKYDVLINAIYDLPYLDGEPMRFYEMEIEDSEKERLMKTGEKSILIVSGVDKG